MTITVTIDDWRHATAGCRTCPLARAITRATGKEVRVVPNPADWDDLTGWRVYFDPLFPDLRLVGDTWHPPAILPVEAAQVAVAFDGEKPCPVLPVRFELAVPERESDAKAKS